MRSLRVLTAIPLVAGLLFAGAASTAASGPVIPGLPSLPNMPFINAGFPCDWPNIDEAPTTTSDNIGPTDESFVFLMSNSQSAPTLPGMPQMPDLNFMKCFFHYPSGTEGDPQVAKNFPCWYDGEGHYHDFAHSTLIVRDMFAILLCWGTVD